MLVALALARWGVGSRLGAVLWLLPVFGMLIGSWRASAPPAGHWLAFAGVLEPLLLLGLAIGLARLPAG